MDTNKQFVRILQSKKSFLLFFLFIFLIVFPILKFETTKVFFQNSNDVKEKLYFPFIVESNSVEKPIELIIENTVSFPDFVLVILTTDADVSVFQNVAENRIDCFYQKHESDRRIVYPSLSVDGYDGGGSRWIVRCPLPPPTHSGSVRLEVKTDTVTGFDWVVRMKGNQTVMSWGNMLAYEASFDGDATVAVFVKGLGLNGEIKSDPSQFTCRFGKDFALVTKAVTAAQEVIRCPLPQGLTQSGISENGEEIQVTVERAIESKVRGRDSIVPSIAKLHKNKNNYNYNDNAYKHELCACTMVWNQAGFIREWIMYHGWLGIQRWFLYDNNSDDELKEVISDLNLENYNVSRHAWPWIKSQEAGFAHCLLRARDQCEWVAFFDVDEFYNIPTSNLGNNALHDLVHNISTSSPLTGQIRIDCFNFGPSGLKVSPSEGVALGYTCRLKGNVRHKSILRPEAVDESLLNRIHHFELKTGFAQRSLPHKIAMINHYKYQVWNVFKAKFVRRVSAYVTDWQEKTNEESNDRTPGLGTEAIEPEDWHLRFCQVWDTRLKDFILANLVDPNTNLLPWQRST
ncbi:hypothetical protein RND81_11G138600 [Saponaria officinalis]|uniref:Glycosyltransferase family 92 protein n=1 Tax=Saponaria officinalis TaxID=3572 RepID=A0AAW1HLV5_SAPOF